MMRDPGKKISATAAKVFLTVGLGTTTLLVAGCYEQNLAPPVEYSEKDVEVLRQEIESMDWE